MRHGLIATAAAFLLVCSVSDAAAQQWVQKTATDSVVIEGVTYPRFSFSMWNFGNAVDLVVGNRLASTSPEDTCRAIRAVGPADWNAVIDPGSGTVVWGRPSPSPAPDGYISGFQLTITPGHASCYEFRFSGPLDDLPFGVENDCFGSGPPVPVAGRTWGGLKARYR